LRGSLSWCATPPPLLCVRRSAGRGGRGWGNFRRGPLLLIGMIPPLRILVKCIMLSVMIEQAIRQMVKAEIPPRDGQVLVRTFMLGGERSGFSIMLPTADTRVRGIVGRLFGALGQNDRGYALNTMHWISDRCILATLFDLAAERVSFVYSDGGETQRRLLGLLREQRESFYEDCPRAFASMSIRDAERITGLRWNGRGEDYDEFWRRLRGWRGAGHDVAREQLAFARLVFQRIYSKKLVTSDKATARANKDPKLILSEDALYRPTPRAVPAEAAKAVARRTLDPDSRRRDEIAFGLRQGDYHFQMAKRVLTPA